LLKRPFDAILVAGPHGAGIVALAHNRIVKFDVGRGLLADIDAAAVIFPNYAIGQSVAQALRALDAELGRHGGPEERHER
jgi:hypothetical protein